MSKWYKFIGRLFKIGYAGADAFRHCTKGSCDFLGDLMLKTKSRYDKKIKEWKKAHKKQVTIIM